MYDLPHHLITRWQHLDALARLRLGIMATLLEANDPAAARVAFDRAIALDPADAVAHTNRGNAHTDLGQDEQACSVGVAIGTRDDTTVLRFWDSPPSAWSFVHHPNALLGQAPRTCTVGLPLM